MKSAFLGLGSNLGDRAELLSAALSLIETRIGKVIRTSSVYETAAWGTEHQPDYLNLVAEVKTNLYPHGLLQQIMETEQVLGRERLVKWGNRTIDIDLLFYEDYHFISATLEVPHPRITERNFVLIPLCEIAGTLVHPVFRKNIYELLEQCTDQEEVRKL